jgi:4-carboxymuconolactone decarboxylase
MTQQTGSVLDLLARMTADSIEVSGLDPKSLMLVRLAALAAVGAPVASYRINLEAATAVGIDADAASGVLAAVAPIVGTAHVATAAANMVEALEFELETVDVNAYRES